MDMGELKVYESTPLPEFIRVDGLVSVYFVDREGMRRRYPYSEAHDFPELAFVSQGVSRNQEGTPSLKSGECIIVPPCVYHGSTACDAAIIMIGFVSESLPLARLYGRVFNLDEGQQQLLSRIAALGQKCFTAAPTGYNMVSRSKDNDLVLHKLKNLLELFLLELYEKEVAEVKQESNYARNQLDGIITYLKGNINRNFTLEEIAENCCVSASKLKQLFREQAQSSPMAYFTYLKIEQAKNLLRNTSCSITRIAEMLGYQSVGYFSRCFKKHTGLSPSDFVRAGK